MTTLRSLIEENPREVIRSLDALAAEIRSLRCDLAVKPGDDPSPMIIEMVAREWGVSVPEVLGTGRPYDVVRARHVAMTLIRDFTGASSVTIAKLFHRRDHTTVLNAWRRCADACEVELSTRARVQSLRCAIAPVAQAAAAKANPKPILK